MEPLARKKLKRADGGAISGGEVANLLGLTRQGVDYLRKIKSVLAWRNYYRKVELSGLAVRRWPDPTRNSGMPFETCQTTIPGAR